MAFMQPQVYFGGYFAVETTHRTEIVPDVMIGRTMGTAAEAFENYVEGKIADLDEVIEHKTGWLARMAAPGYIDCTDWTVHASEAEARAYLRKTYGDDSDA